MGDIRMGCRDTNMFFGFHTERTITALGVAKPTKSARYVNLMNGLGYIPLVSLAIAITRVIMLLIRSKKHQNDSPEMLGKRTCLIRAGAEALQVFSPVLAVADLFFTMGRKEGLGNRKINRYIKGLAYVPVIGMVVGVIRIILAQLQYKNDRNPNEVYRRNQWTCRGAVEAAGFGWVNMPSEVGNWFATRQALKVAAP